MTRSRVLLFGLALFAASILWWARALYSPLLSSARWPFRSESHAADDKWAFVRRPSYFFVFGDSYSSEGLDWQSGAHPLDPHPILTNSGGPIWARYLANRWAPDTTLINLAVDGATVDKAHIRDPAGREDLQWQIAQFQRFFGAANASDSDSDARHGVDWHGGNTLAGLALGTNDVALSSTWLSELQLIETYVSVAQSYQHALSALHAAGVRAFVFAQVLPLDGAGIGQVLPAPDRAKLRGAVRAYNDIVLRRAVRAWCRARKGEVVCVELGTYELAERVMQSPQTYGFQIAHDWCMAYGLRRDPDPDPTAHPDCKGPLRDYVWRDFAHPSYAFHALWAGLYDDAVAEALKSLR